MKVLVCGSRSFNDYNLVQNKLNVHKISELIHGGARGADTLGGQYAERHGIPCTCFPAQWGQYGKSAGPIRNIQMLTEGKPDLVIAFLKPVAEQEIFGGFKDSRHSPGTRHMIEISQKAGIPVQIVPIDGL